MFTLRIVMISILCLSVIIFTSMTWGFELEGSQISYAKFPRWNPCLNGSLSFEFRSTQSNSLLMYMDDGKQWDFIEVKLVGGVVRLRMNLGNGASILSASQHLDDGGWHKVEIYRNNQETTLVVDSIAQTRSSQGDELAFGNLTQNSYVYVGGVPVSFSAKLRFLALPSVIFEPRFRGSIRNVFYSNCGSELTQIEMLSSEGVRTTARNPCEEHNPCQNNGVCVSTDTGSLCQCTGTNYEGQFCESEKLPSEATFYGVHYLSYDLSSGGDPIVSSADEIGLSFKTRQPNGLLFFTGEREDYIIIALREGHVTVGVSLGSGSYQADVRPKRGSIRFDDNQWHHVKVVRETRELTMDQGICHVSITLDQRYRRTGTVVGDFTMLSSERLYVAGSPDVSLLPGATITDNFRGCMKQVVYKADNIELDVTDLARSNHNLITVHGDVLFNKCEDLVQAQPITFTTPGSVVSLPYWNAQLSGNLEFQFRTTEQNGLLMYNLGDGTNRDFFGLEILDGFLYIVLDLGSGSIKLQASDEMISDGLPHKVMLDHNAGSGTINVDGVSESYVTPGSDNQLNLDGSLHIGGIYQEDHLPSQMWTSGLDYGYVGCLQDLVMNGDKIDLAGIARDQDTPGVEEYCRVMGNQCPSAPCMHRGTCTEGWNRFVCDCTQTPYTGTMCNQGSTTVSFDGNQFMLVSLPETVQTEAEDIAVRFKTRRSNGLLLATTAANQSDSLMIRIEAGQVFVELRLGGDMESVSLGHGLDDDIWHTLHLKRRAQFLQLKVDNKTTSRETSDDTSGVINYDRLHIGQRPGQRERRSAVSLPESLTSKRRPARSTSRHGRQTTDTDPEDFVGYMQNMKFNGSPLFEMARTGTGSNRHRKRIESTAIYDNKENLINFPFTFISPQAYFKTDLNIYEQFTMLFQIKTTQANGLIIYSGGGSHISDFIAIELVEGRIYYIFNTGSGTRSVQSTKSEPINDNRWHDIGIIRHSLRQQILRVDEYAAFDNLPESGSVQFNMDDVLYVGGVESDRYASLPKQVRSRQGYQGCMGSLDLDGDSRNILEYRAQIRDEHRDEIVQGCKGPTQVCTPISCHNRGVCKQEWNAFTCDCSMTSFTGETCSTDSTAYTFHSRGGMITYEFPPGQRPDSTADNFALGFRTTQRDAILFRVDSKLSNDYIEMELMDGNVFVVYNMGTMNHPIGELFNKVNDGRYHIVRFTRSGPNSTIQVDDLDIQTKNPTGVQLSIFNNQAYVYVGGKPGRNNTITRPFHGSIAGVVLNGLQILDLAVSEDRQITVDGDVELEMGQLRSASEVTQIAPNGVMVTPAPGETATIASNSFTDDLVFSGTGSGCNADDEDDCVLVGSGDPEALVTPVVKINTTPAPTTTKRPRRTTTTTQPPLIGPGSGEGPCDDDDEDCEGSGAHIVSTTTTTKRPPPEKPTPESVTPKNKNNNDDISIDPKNPRPPTGSTTPNVQVFQVNMTEVPPKHPVPVITTRRSPHWSERSTYPPIPDHEQDNNINNGNTIIDTENGGESLESAPETNLISPFGINMGLIIGIAAGVLILICILIFALYKYKSRDEGSYKCDESKNYPYGSPRAAAAATTTASVGKPSPTANGAYGTNKSGTTNKPKKKDVKEWYV